MLKNGGGSIVNLASIAGLNGIPYTGAYCASKHAVVGLTKAGALDYATEGIRINAVAPGAAKTEIIVKAMTQGIYNEAGISAMHPHEPHGHAAGDCQRHRLAAFRRGVIRDWTRPQHRWRISSQMTKTATPNAGFTGRGDRVLFAFRRPLAPRQ
jgi:NAD(P)-dependent dehydrogenase (short-subunit alcohol dehydrogenase family)